MSLSGFNHIIHWSEFNIVDHRPPMVHRDAQVVVLTNINWRTESQQHGDCQVTHVTASLRVDQNKSWVLKGKKGIYLRHHEQGHFDITAIGMREMYRQITALVKTSCEQVNQEARRIQHEILHRINEARLRYDNQTDEGKDHKVQKTWEVRIKAVKNRADGTLGQLPT